MKKTTAIFRTRAQLEKSRQKQIQALKKRRKTNFKLADVGLDVKSFHQINRAAIKVNRAKNADTAARIFQLSGINNHKSALNYIAKKGGGNALSAKAQRYIQRELRILNSTIGKNAIAGLKKASKIGHLSDLQSHALDNLKKAIKEQKNIINKRLKRLADHEANEEDTFY